MNQSFGLLFYLKKPKNYVIGLLPIYVRITVEEQRVEFSLKRKCLPEKWNSHSGRMAGTKEDARSPNSYIDSMQGQIYAAYQSLISAKTEITALNIKNKLTGTGERPHLLIEIFKHHNEQFPSTHTLIQDGDLISNDSVVIAIRFILAEELVCYGYNKVTDDLRQQGMIINYKKTYRLMREHRLLCGAVIKAQSGKRQFVQWLVQQAGKPMEQLCMDIKYVHIHGQNRNALLLTVLDVYTRNIVGQVLWWQMRKEHVIWLMHRILSEYQVSAVTLRNDNGSQFIAHDVREYLKEKQVLQEFIHVATPEENCFIEAYHSIIQRELLDPRQFDSVEHAQQTFERWQLFYNNRRLHGSLGNKAPQYIWKRYEEQQLKEEPLLNTTTEALSTNGERKSLKIAESRLVDKIFKEQMSIIFEDQRAPNAQTAPENPSS